MDFPEVCCEYRKWMELTYDRVWWWTL